MKQCLQTTLILCAIVMGGCCSTQYCDAYDTPVTITTYKVQTTGCAAAQNRVQVYKTTSFLVTSPVCSYIPGLDYY